MASEGAPGSNLAQQPWANEPESKTDTGPAFQPMPEIAAWLEGAPSVLDLPSEPAE